MLPLEWISSLPEVSYAPGAEVIAGGSHPGKICFLKSGRVKVVRDGARVALIKTPGSVLGEISVLLEIAATATVIALLKTVFYMTDEPARFLKENPDVHYHVSKTPAYRLDD